MATKSKGVIYLRRLGFDYFQSDRPEMLHVDFSPTTVADLEIISRDELTKLLLNFITVNKLLPSRLMILLSDAVLFQKDITSDKQPEIDEQTKSFINNVPFEHVSSITLPIEKSHRILATNCDLYSIIQSVFEKQGFQIAAVISSVSFGKQFVVGDHMGADQARVVVQKIDAIKPTENFLEQPKSVLPEQQLYAPVLTQKKKPAKSSLPLLLGVFGVLLAILGGVYYMQTKQNMSQVAQAEQIATPPPVLPTEVPALEPSPVVSSESAVLVDKTIKIQILNGSGIVGQAENGRKQLLTLGFENITTGNAASSATKTLIIFKQSVPESVRKALITELQKTYQEISTQETNESEYDAIITLGNIIVTQPSISPTN